MSIRNGCAAVLMILFASNGHAGPILTLYDDDINISTDMQVPLVGGGTFQQSTSYSGPLLPQNRSVPMIEDLLEDWQGGGNHLLVGNSSAELSTDWGGLNLELESQVELIFESNLPATDPLLWDSTTYPLANATGMLDWTFSLDQDAAFNLYLELKGANGIVAARLRDLTTDENIFGFRATHFSDFGDFPDGGGQQWWGQFNSTLLAGHKYSLSAHVSESSIDDDDESLFNFFIPGVSGVQVHDVPEPSAIILYGMGLLAIAATRRRRNPS